MINFTKYTNSKNNAPDTRQYTAIPKSTTKPTEYQTHTILKIINVLACHVLSTKLWSDAMSDIEMDNPIYGPKPTSRMVADNIEDVVFYRSQLHNFFTI